MVNIPTGALILMLTLLLAWASYRYVEQPARRSDAPASRIFARYYVMPAGVILVASLIAIYPDRIGITLVSEGYRRRLEQMRVETQPAFLSESVCQRQRVVPKDVLREATGINALHDEAG